VYTEATIAAATGAPLAQIMARIGHSTPRAALICQHATSDGDRAIAAALSDFAGGKVSPLGTRRNAGSA